MNLIPTGVVRWMKRATFMEVCLIVFAFLWTSVSHAAGTQTIDQKVDVALERFTGVDKGGKDLFRIAKGVLIIPDIIKAGFIVGAEYGEGALRVGGKTVDYYSTFAGSVGGQVGVQKKTVILVFMGDEVLEKFRESSGWKAGADGSVILGKLGVAGFLDTATANESIITFVLDQGGLMFNVNLEGGKFTRLRK